MLFSIIVPVYNVAEYIHRCVDSLLCQTFKDIEIILVDDGGTDDCPSICDEYAAREQNIKVVHKTNGGLSDARNAGIAVALGQYIMFVDSDDYVEADACERFAVFAGKGYDVLIGDAVVEGGICPLGHIAPNTDRVYTGREYLKASHKEGKAPMAAWLNIYRREFLIQNRLEFRYGILHEDEQFTPRALLAAATVIVTGISFYHYIIRKGSITTKKDKRKNAADMYVTCCELETIYKKIEDTELKSLLLDSLSSKYLNLFCQGELYRYGREYVHKDIVKRTARLPKTKKKAFLYGISPRLYCFTNKLVGKIRG